MQRPKRKPPFRVLQFLLDKFSQTDLRSWKRYSDNDEEYHVRLFHHLEALRSIHDQELRDVLYAAKTSCKKAKSWYRIVDFQYSDEILSCRGSLLNGGRFNIGKNLDPRKYPAFPALYIAEHFGTAYYERFGAPHSSSGLGLKGHEFALRDPSSFTAVKLSFELSNLLDLSSASNLHGFAKIISQFEMPDDLKTLGKSIGRVPPWLVTKAGHLKKSLLANDWRMYPVQYGIPANPQVFGRILRDAGFEGVIYPSTKGTGKCIAVFIENLSGSDSYIELRDSAPTGVEYTRLCANNWKELC